MKKIRFILCALAALAFASCQQVSIQENTEQNEETPAINYVFNITVANPDGADTKSVKTGWEEGDVIGLWMDASDPQGRPAQFSLTFNGQNWECSPNQDVTLGPTGHLSALYKGDNNPYNLSGSIPLMLSCEGVEYTSVINPDGSVEVTAALSNWVYETPIQIVIPGIEANFGDYTLSCEDLAAGDGIDFSIDSDNNFAQFSIANAELGNAATGVLNKNTSTDGNSNGGAAFYFTESNASTAKTFTFVLSYNGKSYTYTSKPTIIYADGTDVKRINKKLPEFKINENEEPVSGCKWDIVGDDSINGFVKVTAAPDDWSGEYLLVYEVSENEGRCWTGEDAANCFKPATIDNGVISSKPNGAVTVTLSSMTDGYSIIVNGNNGNYISGKSGSNTIVYSDTPVKNEIQFSDGAVTIYSNSTSFRYNSASGNDRFRYYKTTTTGTTYILPALYKLVGEPAPAKQDQTLTFPQESYEIILGETFTAPTVVGAQTTVTYSSSDDEVATVDASTGAVQILSAGEVTITATASSDNTYNEGGATYTITIIAALTTINDIYEASETPDNYMVTFDNWVVSGVKGDNAYVTDGAKGFIIYKSGHGFAVGDVLSGTVNSCALKRFHGAAEFTNITSTTEGLTVTKGGSITPATFSISELSGVNTGAVITFDNLTYNGTVFTDGTNNIKPYSAFITLPELTSGAHYKVTGVYVQYDATKEIAPRTAEDISEIVATKYTITIAGGILNGSVSANKTEAAAGVEVTLTATPAIGYGLAAWSVKDASNNSITVTNNKFTMPASNVTVSATFKDVSSEYGIVTFDFTSDEALTAMGITPPASSAGTRLTSCVLNPITIINTKDGGTETRVWNSGGKYDLRVYKNAEFTITSTSNSITKVEFDGTGVVSASTGTYIETIWTGNSTEVTFTCSSTSNGNIKTINVTYGNPPVAPYLNATADKTNVSAAGETVTITVDTNIEGWTVTSDNDAAFTVGTMSGNTVPVVVSENTSTTDGRTAHITVSADGVPDVVLTLTQDAKSNGGQGGELVDNPKVLTFDLRSNPGLWPTTNSSTLTDYSYELDDTVYTFGLKNVKCNSGYLMCIATAAFGLPAISGYKLTKVVASNSGGCSTSVNVGISSSSSSASYIDGGDAQKWATTNSSYTYNLSGTTNNTVYYLYVTNKNAQITELTLTYTQATPNGN